MEPERLKRLITHAQARYLRRRAATDWWWNWCLNKWCRQPKLVSRVKVRQARQTPALYRSPASHGYVLYEDCLALEDEAYMLVTRLLARQKSCGRNINPSIKQLAEGRDR